MVDDFRSKLAVLPLVVWNKQPSIPHPPKDVPGIVDSIPELFIIDKVVNQVIKRPVILGTPSLKRTRLSNTVKTKHRRTYADGVAEVTSLQVKIV